MEKKIEIEAGNVGKVLMVGRDIEKVVRAMAQVGPAWAELKAVCLEWQYGRKDGAGKIAIEHAARDWAEAVHAAHQACVVALEWAVDGLGEEILEEAGRQLREMGMGSKMYDEERARRIYRTLAQVHARVLEEDELDVAWGYSPADLIAWLGDGLEIEYEDHETAGEKLADAERMIESIAAGKED